MASYELSMAPLPSFLPAVALSVSPVSVDISRVLRGAAGPRLWCPGGPPSLPVAGGFSPANTICSPISGPHSLSPAGSARLFERKGPLRRDQALK